MRARPSELPSQRPISPGAARKRTEALSPTPAGLCGTRWVSTGRHRRTSCTYGGGSRRVGERGAGVGSGGWVCAGRDVIWPVGGVRFTDDVNLAVILRVGSPKVAVVDGGGVGGGGCASGGLIFEGDEGGVEGTRKARCNADRLGGGAESVYIHSGVESEGERTSVGWDTRNGCRFSRLK